MLKRQNESLDEASEEELELPHKEQIQTIKHLILMKQILLQALWMKILAQVQPYIKI